MTEGYRADRETVIRILNEALATELVCVLRYKRHYFMATAIHAQVADNFSNTPRKREHGDRIAERITQLGGAPDFNPEVLAKHSHSQYVEANPLQRDRSAKKAS